MIWLAAMALIGLVIAGLLWLLPVARTNTAEDRDVPAKADDAEPAHRAP